MRADVASCINLHASGQREAKAGRLKLASELFASCASSEDCPDAIRVECVELHRDIKKNVPTVTFAVVDEHGKDITDVRVYSTDQLLAESLDGRGVALDPGKHHFKFVLPQGDVISSDVLVREGEKNRVVSVRMQDRTRAHSEPSPTPGHAVVQESTASAVLAPDAGAARRGSPPMGFWVSAGVGAAALASFGAFALLGHNRQSKIAECSPNCDSSRHEDFDTMRRDYLIADISLGVALASAGVATWFLLSNKHSHSAAEEPSASRRATRVFVEPVFWTRGAGLVVHTSTF